MSKQLVFNQSHVSSWDNDEINDEINDELFTEFVDTDLRSPKDPMESELDVIREQVYRNYVNRNSQSFPHVVDRAGKQTFNLLNNFKAQAGIRARRNGWLPKN